MIRTTRLPAAGGILKQGTAPLDVSQTHVAAQMPATPPAPEPR